MRINRIHLALARHFGQSGWIRNKQNWSDKKDYYKNITKSMKFLLNLIVIDTISLKFLLEAIAETAQCCSVGPRFIDGRMALTLVFSLDEGEVIPIEQAAIDSQP